MVLRSLPLGQIPNNLVKTDASMSGAIHICCVRADLSIQMFALLVTRLAEQLNG